MTGSTGKVVPFIHPRDLARAMADPGAIGEGPDLEPFRFAHDPAVRGYVPLYGGASTICPGCHRSAWWIGSVTAECAYCATALPLVRTVR